MIPTPRFTQELSECSNALLAGGKAANLGRLLRAGFAVPDGFVVNTRAYDCAKSQGAARIPPEVAEEIQTAYRLLGRGLVAVRSSATAEDMVGASMAGQYETFLNIEGESALLKAIRRCWASLDVPRVQAYLREHGIEGPQSRRVAIGRGSPTRNYALGTPSPDASRSQLGIGRDGCLRPRAAGCAAPGAGYGPGLGSDHRR